MSDPSKIGVNTEFEGNHPAVYLLAARPSPDGHSANVLGTVVGLLIMQVISTSFNMLLIRLPGHWF